MDPSNSTSPNSSTDSKPVASAGPFAYQTRLLERTASRGSSGSLSRSNSQSGKGILGNLNGSSITGPGSKRWAPSHRIGNSLDAVRGKWEERARAETVSEDPVSPTNSLMEGSPRDDAPSPLNRNRSFDIRSSQLSSDHRPLTPPSYAPDTVNLQRTPTYLKRQTMPAPIIASPLSPNTTGVTVEVDSISSPFNLPSPQRIHLPTSTPSLSSPGGKRTSGNGIHSPFNATTHSPLPSRYRRSNTWDPENPNLTGSSQSSANVSPIRYTPASSAHSQHSPPPPSPIQRRPTSMYGSPSSQLSPTRSVHRPSSSPNEVGFEIGQSERVKATRETYPTPPSPSSSVMFPPQFKSSYMSNKKASTYTDSFMAGRKLGRHLPRIASGDGNEEPTEREAQEEAEGASRRERRERRLRNLEEDNAVEPPKTPRKDYGVTTKTSHADDVAGIPGRLRLSKDKVPSSPQSPLPSARLTRGLWADTQRHLIQAYEYLCHVGEAQQWIEGCLGEELGFGVVEMEDGLRNGVVLAKLVRVFRGEGVVRKIYEAPKLDFRHSDNINYFFNFVRDVGLPEGFIFELTDLYEKKNLPKVIYCIHALSHLLARRGMAERIGNLLGRLKFSDDQLQKTQKGLKDAGVVMPNFGNIGNELAREINEEPEVEIETEDERRDRLLLENEASIVALQCVARGFLIRKAQATQRVRLRLAERNISKLQASCRAALLRSVLETNRQRQANLSPWVIALQAAARGVMSRRRWRSQQRRIKSEKIQVVKLQAHLRGVLQRRRMAQMKSAMRITQLSVIKLQALARGRLTRDVRKEATKIFSNYAIDSSIVSLQAYARGALRRRQAQRQIEALHKFKAHYIALQAHCRGVLMRRRLRTQMAKLEDVTHVVIRIQAAVRTFLARKRLLLLIRGLRRATPSVLGLQARARATLARQQHRATHKALSEVKVIAAASSLQSFARAALTRNRHREQTKRLEFVEPDVVGMQSAARGALVRRDFHAWRDHLWRSQPVATILQAMLRGVLQRNYFRAKMQYYRTNLQKVVKIQSLFRAKETREQYRQLTLGKNVTVGTIKNFVHLLDDSEADFQEEIKVERLRKRVVEGIRENQALENDVSELDVKIALVVQNVKSFEEVVKARRKHGADSAAAHAARASLLAAYGDPFAGPSTLDHAAKRKLELYQQLFYLLQTKGEYLSRLFLRMSMDTALEKNRRLIERVVLTLFGYGQDSREDYLLLKLFQLAIQEEISSSASLDDIIRGHPMYISIAVHYVRPKQITYAREAFQAIIREIVAADDLDLEADPSAIYRARIEVDEMRTGMVSSRSKDVPFYEALNDPDTRAEYIRHLQILQWWTETFVTAITQSTKRMPYGMRYLARETLISLRSKFPDAPEQSYTACIGRIVYYRYINPAIITPETFEIVTSTIDVAARKNLAQISKVLTQITGGLEFGDEDPSYVPINDYVRKAISQMSTWMLEVASVPDAESQFHAHEFLDATVQPKPIYISPNEVYSMHGLLSQNLEHLAPTRDDTLKAILAELDGVPNLGSDELKDARDKAITLELSNRFANVRDPRADEKALWVQAKRGVLAILRVQPAQDLVESLMRPVTEEDEVTWENILENELENEQTRKLPRRQPSAAGAEAGYRLEDIRSLTFKEVKAHAIFFLLELEKQGKISRSDGFQGILNAIAGDVRSKHRKRVQRQQEMENMNGALQHLAERKKYFEEQINSYHDYVDTAMNTMQRGKGKKRFVLPFTKQFYHLRDLQKSGKPPQFGSFKYSAKYLYEKGILLSIDQYSPRQFDKIDFTISSNKAGIFSLLLEAMTLGISAPVASEEIRMEDLLDAQYKNRQSLSIFKGLVKVNLNLFLYQINKKFYV